MKIYAQHYGLCINVKTCNIGRKFLNDKLKRYRIIRSCNVSLSSFRLELAERETVFRL